jgi:hypothetical protein
LEQGEAISAREPVNEKSLLRTAVRIGVWVKQNNAILDATQKKARPLRARAF